MRRRSTIYYDENITGATPTEDESSGPGTVNGIVANARWVKLRDRPDTSEASGTLLVMKKGDKLEIISKEYDMFYKVRHIPSGLIGHIHKNYCEEV